MSILKYKILLLIIMASHTLSLHGQELKGTVYGGKKPLKGAVLYWKENNNGTTTDSSGKFKINKKDTLAHTLVIKALGYKTDSMTIQFEKEVNIFLDENGATVEVVFEEVHGTLLSRSSPGHTELINKKELLRAACCNLSESFETSASVDVNYTDAVSGARQIRMLGLDGAYTQIQIENLPGIRGLSGTYGLTAIPGPWVESIQVTKGAGSVVNGYESMAGQINLEMIKPQTAKKFFLNLYADAMGRSEINTYGTYRFSDTLSTMLMVHADGSFLKADLNNDGFLDNPISRQISFRNRWHYSDNNKIESQFGIDGTWQDIYSGQNGFKSSTDKLGSNVYGIGTNYQRMEAFGKLGFLFPSKPYKSIGTMVSAVRLDYRSYYGQKAYSGTENTVYGNFIYQSIINNSFHTIKAGASFMLDSFSERLDDINSARLELVPGMFSEYTYKPSDKITAVAGLRLDFHNMFGTMFTPRAHLRLEPVEGTTFRISAGKGYRTPNPWVEFAGYWVSSRKIIEIEKPGQEQSWNYGGSFQQNFKLNKKKGYLSIDFFRTDFVNQYIIDLDANPQQALLYNLKGISYANSAQAEIGYDPARNINLKAAYKYYDVKTTYQGILMQKPLQPTQRFLFTASWADRHKKYVVDATALWYGHARLPNTDSNPAAYKKEGTSPAYWVFHLQVTRNFKKWAIYAGSENLLDYKQPNPILSAQDPFGPYFDASMIWGPVAGRRIYGGLRYSL